MAIDTRGRSGVANALMLAAMSLGYGVVQLDVTIVNTALASIGSGLGGGVTALQWVVSTYTIAFAAFILTAGALGDRLGAKRVFIAGFAIFTLASFGCAVASTMGLLIAARAVQGLGAAILVPNSLALLNHSFTQEKARGRAVAIWAAGASLALTAGPLAGGALIAIAGWRSIFLVNLPIGLAGLFLAMRYARDTPRRQDRALDSVGQILAIATLGSLAAALIEAGNAGWTKAFVLAGFAIAIVAGALFVAQENRVSQPMLPLGLFAHRLFALTSAVGLLVNIAFYGAIFVLSLYFQQVNHLSPLVTGLSFVPMMGIVLPANLIAPRLTERVGAPAVIAAGAGIAAIGALALLPIARGTSYGALVTQLLLMGGGLGLLVPPLTSTLLGSVEKNRSGTASGVLNATRQTGSVLGVALFGSLVGAEGAFVAGARISFAIAAAVLIGGAATILTGLPGRTARKRPREATPGAARRA